MLKNRELKLLATFARIKWGFCEDYLTDLFTNLEKIKKLDKEMIFWPSVSDDKNKQAGLQVIRNEFESCGEVSDKAMRYLKENIKDWRKYLNRLNDYRQNKIELKDKMVSFISRAEIAGQSIDTLLKSWARYIK